MAKGAFYPNEYEELWKAYAAPANASKKMGHIAYKKATDLPAHDLLLCCVEAYNEFLKANSRPNQPYPRAHLATWLNQARWEGFLDRGEELLRLQKGHREAKEAAVSATSQSWPTATISRLTLSPAIVERWFLPCTFIPGEPPELIAPSRFHADWLLTKFYSQIERALGPGTVVSYQ